MIIFSPLPGMLISLYQHLFGFSTPAENFYLFTLNLKTICFQQKMHEIVWKVMEIYKNNYQILFIMAIGSINVG